MNIDNMISEYQNERSRLKFSLNTASKNPERLEEILKEIEEIEQKIEELEKEKNASKTYNKYNRSHRIEDDDIER